MADLSMADSLSSRDMQSNATVPIQHARPSHACSSYCSASSHAGGLPRAGDCATRCACLRHFTPSLHNLLTLCLR